MLVHSLCLGGMRAQHVAADSCKILGSNRAPYPKSQTTKIGVGPPVNYRFGFDCSAQISAPFRVRVAPLHFHAREAARFEIPRV